MIKIIEKYNILITGVGGQGVMSMGKILRDYALNSPYIENFISTESRGVSQREGSVYLYIQYDLKNQSGQKEKQKYLSPNPTIQNIDLLISLEPLEFFRNLQYICPTGKAIVNTEIIFPKSILNKKKIKTYDIQILLKQLQETYPSLTIIAKNWTNLQRTKGKKIININSELIKILPDHCPDIFNKDILNEILDSAFLFD